MASSSPAQVLKARLSVDLGVARGLGAAMLALGAILPHVGHDPGLPCPLRTLTGVPCPVCGMTTSVKAVCTGRLHAAIAANPAGLLAVGVAALLLVRPRWQQVQVPLTAVIVLASCSWVWELRRFGWI